MRSIDLVLTNMVHFVKFHEKKVSLDNKTPKSLIIGLERKLPFLHTGLVTGERYLSETLYHHEEPINLKVKNKVHFA